MDKLILPQQNLNANILTNNFAHFQGLSIQSYLKAEPKLLIGLQNLELVAPLEARIGKPGEASAVRSRLGWAVYGPCQHIDAGVSYSPTENVAVDAHFVGMIALKWKNMSISERFI